jgi:hypothetical protein
MPYFKSLWCNLGHVEGFCVNGTSHMKAFVIGDIVVQATALHLVPITSSWYMSWSLRMLDIRDWTGQRALPTL